MLIGAYGSSPRVPAVQMARRLRRCGERGRRSVPRQVLHGDIDTIPGWDGSTRWQQPPNGRVERQPSGDHGLCECQGGERLGDGADL